MILIHLIYQFDVISGQSLYTLDTKNYSLYVFVLWIFWVTLFLESKLGRAWTRFVFTHVSCSDKWNLCYLIVFHFLSWCHDIDVIVHATLKIVQSPFPIYKSRSVYRLNRAERSLDYHICCLINSYSCRGMIIQWSSLVKEIV